ncbi:MAG: 50S ribosomal protein L25 [Caldisericia bacterium]|nr:50S ribosomal protein L25 [Caldisericia bacterium]
MEVFEFELKNRDKTNPYLVPAVVYGKGMDNISLAFDRKDFVRLVKHNSRNIFLQCKLPDGKVIPAIIQEIQKDVVTLEPYHVDFLAVSKSQDITITVPIKLTNKENCMGIKNSGKMQHVLFKMKLSGKPEVLPKEILIDIEAFDIGTVIFTRDIKLDDGVTLSSPSDLKIMSVFSRSAAEIAAEEEEKAAEEEKADKKAAPAEEEKAE